MNVGEINDDVALELDEVGEMSSFVNLSFFGMMKSPKAN
jgi:hypothetical protein